MRVWRTVLAGLDQEIINLIKRRMRVSKEVQRIKVEHGLPRTDLKQEMTVIGHYWDELGDHAGALANEILNLSKDR